MKKIFGIVFLLILMTVNCHAMTLSQPVEIGWIGVQPYVRHSKTEGLGVRQAAEVKGVHLTGKYYKKGVARWGEGKNALYCHFEEKLPQDGLKFGSEDISNTVSAGSSYGHRTILKIESSTGKIFYALYYRCAVYGDYILIGQTNDGKWVKYFVADTVKWKNDGRYAIALNIHCDNDTIVVDYENTMSNAKVGEMRYKWDEAAQWFGVEKIVY